MDVTAHGSTHDLLASLGMIERRRALLWRGARWLALQTARVEARRPWQDGWPPSAIAVLRELERDETTEDPGSWTAPAVTETGQFTRLAVALGLGPAATDLFAALVIAALDVDFARVWNALPVVPNAPAYTAGTWIEVLGDTAAHRREMLAVLHPDHVLRRLRCITLDDSAPATAAAGVPPEVVAQLVEASLRRRPTAPEPELVLDPDATRGLAELAGQQPRRLALLGTPGSGRRTRAIRIAELLGFGATVLEPSLDGDPEELTRGLRDAVIAELVPIVVLPHADARELPTRWWRQLARFEGTLYIVGAVAIGGDLARRVPGLVELRVERPRGVDQQTMWRDRLRRGDITFADELPELLVAAYDLLPGDIDQLASRVVAQRRGGRAEIADVQAALTSATTSELYGLAQPYHTTLRWDDVVLPPATTTLLKELIAHIRHRTTVFETWGFGAKVTYGRSLSALFYGPPGTGKTMVAGILARDFGRDLYRVDLSRVVDKYVGETEKNLRRVFDEARKTHAMLLFDEADALFSKRTKVDSSNDRYANLAVNFLLQEMEQFEGCCILTTNLDSTLDEAFRRRLRFRIEFPRPTDEERRQLWPSMVPSAAPLAQDVDWDELVEAYEKMTGAHIKNAVLRAAFLAAADGTPITQALLRQAAKAEYEETGHVSGR